ncbi:MAG: porin, partial [Gemmatimonadota bacterium]
MPTRLVAGPCLLVLLIPLSIRAQQPAPASSAPPAAPSTAPTVKVTGYLQARETYQNKVGLTGTINRARVNIEGTLPGHFSWRIQPEYEVPGTAGAKATVSLRDAFVRWNLSSWTVTAGQFKTPFTREFIASIAVIETADRATVVDSLAPKRDIGVMGEYAFGSTGTLALGVFNGEGQNSVNNRDTTVLVVSRGTVRPIPQVSLGANIAYYRADSTRYGFDAAFEQRGLTLKGEYIWEHRKAKSPEDN